MLNRVFGTLIGGTPTWLKEAIPDRVKDPIKEFLGLETTADRIAKANLRGRAIRPGIPGIEALPPDVAAIQWFHSIDLGNGIVTPGEEDTPAKVASLHLPDSFSGKTVLDIGAWDGFFSFDAEKRGAARVLATDHFCWAGPGWGTKAGFDLAKRVKGSRVEEKIIDVMDLSPETVGTFDVVLFLGVIYHVKAPYLILERVASVTHGMMILESEVLWGEENLPVFYFYPGYVDDPSNFWIPSPAGLEAMVRAVGFKKISVKYCSSTRKVPQGRMVLHAWK